MTYYFLICVIDFQSSSNKYVCDPSTLSEQLLDMSNEQLSDINDICDNILVENTIINANKNETHTK